MGGGSCEVTGPWRCCCDQSGQGLGKRKRQRLRVHVDPVSCKELRVELLKQIIAMVAINEWPRRQEREGKSQDEGCKERQSAGEGRTREAGGGEEEELNKGRGD